MKLIKIIIKSSQIYIQVIQRNIVINKIEIQSNHSENEIKKYIKKLK